MSGSNSLTRISTDGTVVTYDRHGVKIKDLSGELPVLHKIVEINRMSAKSKAKLPNDIKLYSTQFYIVREDTGESIELPIQHIIPFIEDVKKDDVQEFIENLILQIPK